MGRQLLGSLVSLLIVGAVAFAVGFFLGFTSN
ncbi:hypothetical protein SAMN05421543_11553 [Alicyclobacillus macrosporangiidus]|uniref:Uncharacterized protein n=1 Tax=Alicyclobacillus macrosporangiidus TaxID=392015 RepID=A0A1I7KDH2_9BACL|nr:hypothetical protein SAMN05421543_11553 [Alicyclobacillus macrosporangiidus]